MTVRIRYEKTDDEGILCSVRNFYSKRWDAMYIVYLNINEVTFYVKNMLSGRKYTGGDNTNNLHVLKRQVKKKLEGLGVEFGDEIRDNSSRKVGVNCGYRKKED